MDKDLMELQAHSPLLTLGLQIPLGARGYQIIWSAVNLQ